jgi:hypothetical protein
VLLSGHGDLLELPLLLGGCGGTREAPSNSCIRYHMLFGMWVTVPVSLILSLPLPILSFPFAVPC